jgi:orotidine-5'-phosphate decarboxylase
MPNALDAESRLIIALDVSDAGLAYEVCQRIGLPRAIYKIGLELLFSGGMELIGRLSAEGRPVFVDAKLLDIGNTVERATARIAALGAKYLTVHAHDRQTLEAAIRGRKGSELKLWGVTLLTSTPPESLKEQGCALPPEELVLLRATFAAEAGFDGVVASPREAAALKARFGEKLAIVTPGIRPASASVAGDDQARTSTPGQALLAGADYLVVGRPILQAHDPAAAARAVLQEMADALKS